MLSQTVEYALRAAVHLAHQYPEPRTTDQIAQATAVPKAYLSKVLQSLRRGGAVLSQRGVGGGMTLAKDPREMTLLDVINSVEPLARIRTCPMGIGSHGSKLCPLHRQLDDLLAHLEREFARTTLASVFSDPAESIPLCPMPQTMIPLSLGPTSSRDKPEVSLSTNPLLESLD